MSNRWITLAATMTALMTTGLASAQTTKDAPDSEEEALREQDTAPGVDTEEAFIEGVADDTQIDVAKRPAEEGAAAQGVSSDAGTEEAERERMREGIGTVSSRKTRRQEGEDMIPLRFNMHGFYRMRYNWVQNAPLESDSATNEMPSGDASFGYMRLRLDPEISYGPNEDLPIARLRFTIDGFDNVVLGDNARVFSTPLFAVDQSITNIDGRDWRDSLRLERAWIEFLVPVGQIRVGRMESQWGVGLLTHAGNGLAEWGDFLQGETFDRILFATRPITLGRAIKNGDTRQTPLVYAFVYDRISQNSVADPTITTGSGAAQDYTFAPFYTSFDTQPNSFRSQFPLEYLTDLDNRVNEVVNVLAWVDPDYGPRDTDELFLGAYMLYRWQEQTDSHIFIPDIAWRLQHSIGKSKRIAIRTEGEFFTIQGRSGALAFTGDCPPAPCNEGNGRIYNALARIGVLEPGKWAFRFEGGFASGDTNLRGDPTLKTRGFNTNVKVGLLMYQVALKALGYDRLSRFNATELGPNGSVWNSKYLYPQYRIMIVPGLEAHATFLVGWASKLDPIVFNVPGGNDSCGLSKDCFLGWEADFALRARIGQDIVWVDLEGGVMQPGKAFTNAGVADSFLWTIQMRAAMVF